LEHVSSLLVKQLDQVLLEQLGIGYAQFKVLRVLADLGLSGQKQIADELSQTEASISRQIRLLRGSGLVSLRVDPANRRQHLARLTRLGMRFTAAADSILSRYQYQLFSPLKPKDQSMLKQALERVQNSNLLKNVV
jgi:DNA-binding MarR family transcriptional regulator